jgi:1-acyl-sn-glycerol-3-phosphate acyltransferase
MLKRLHATWTYVSTWGPFALITIYCGGLGAIASVLRVKSVSRRCLHWWAKWTCRSLGLTPLITYDQGADWARDLAHLRQGVMIANHASHLDIILIAALAPLDIRILAKSSLFKVPFLGWYLRACGHIPVYRGAQRHLNKTIGQEAIKRAIAEGATLFFFPEGTRSKDGLLRPFKSGAFMVAERYQLITYPIFVSGTSLLLRSGGRVIHKDSDTPCTIKFLPELCPLIAAESEEQQEVDSVIEERAQESKERAERLYQEAFTQA